MNVTRGLIIDDPWIHLILDGSKTWEMRSKGVSFRGWFGLIRKRTDCIYGVANLIGAGAALTTEQMIATQNKHRVPEHLIRDGQTAKWRIPWYLDGIINLAKPVVYGVKSGPVIWVLLEPEVSAAISRQLGEQGYG